VPADGWGICLSAMRARIWESIALKKTHNSDPKQNFKNPLINFFGMNMKSLYAKFQLFSFKTEEGVWHDGWAEDIPSSICVQEIYCNEISNLEVK